MDVLMDTSMEDKSIFQQSPASTGSALTSAGAGATTFATKPVCILHWNDERTANKLRVELGARNICMGADLSTICLEEHVTFEALYLIVDSRMAEKFMKERVFDALEWLDRFSALGKPIYVIDDIKDERKFNTTFYRLPQSAEKYKWRTGNNSQDPLTNSFVQIGLKNECTVKTVNPGFNYITQLGSESTNITNIHIGDTMLASTTKITITSMEQDSNAERRLIKVFKDKQCIINSDLPLYGALLTSVEAGSVILHLKLDSTISLQEFLQHTLSEILTCLLSNVEDKLMLNVRVDSLLSVDVKDVILGHKGQPADITPKTFAEKVIQTKLTWMKSNPEMIDSTSPSTCTDVLPPNMSNKHTPTTLMDVPTQGETASLPPTPSKSDNTDKVRKSPQHKTEIQLDSYTGKSSSKSSDLFDLHLVKETMSIPSLPRSSQEETSVSSAKDKPQAVKKLQAVKTAKKINACNKLFKGQLPYFERPQTRTSSYFKIARVLDYKDFVQYEPIYVGKSDDISHRLDQLFRSRPDTVPSSLSPSSIETYLARLTPEEYENISVFWVDRAKDKHQCKGCSMRDCFIREWGDQLEFMDKDGEWSEGEETEETNSTRKVIFPAKKSNVRPGFSSPPKKPRVSQGTYRLSQQYKPVASRKGDKHGSAPRFMNPEYDSGSEVSAKSSVCGPKSTTMGSSSNTASGSSTTLGYSTTLGNSFSNLKTK